MNKTFIEENESDWIPMWLRRDLAKEFSDGYTVGSAFNHLNETDRAGEFVVSPDEVVFVTHIPYFPSADDPEETNHVLIMQPSTGLIGIGENIDWVEYGEDY